MVNKNDWRLMRQESYLMGKQLLHRPWEQLSPNWDHDNCEFCDKKFESPANIGYCTIEQKHWICEECFHDFKEMFQWNISSGD